jgi:hypothetical protein
MELAKAKGLTNTEIMLIDSMHEHLNCVINNISLEHDEALVRQHVFQLQELWGFSQDARYHQWVKRVSRRFRELLYVGAVYRCKTTGETLTITAQELDAYKLVIIGNGFIDFGGVVRLINLERVK